MWKIEELGIVTSTNWIAKERLAAGTLGHGAVLQAMHQTAGRGRLADRKWEDEQGSALLMTVVLEHLPFLQVSLVSYFAALAVAKAVRSIFSNLGRSGSNVRIKWPNDLLIFGKKVCGVLCEGIWQGQTLKGVVIGIGLNVRQKEFEHSLADRATSLALSCADLSVNDVRDIVLDSIANDLIYYESLNGEGAKKAMIETLRKELEWMKGLPPLEVLLTDDVSKDGLRYDGISDDGALWLRHFDGTRETFVTGSLRWNDAEVIRPIPDPITT